MIDQVKSKFTYINYFNQTEVNLSLKITKALPRN